jgi:tetratricopeptide (TPR) repeat protein
MFSIFGLFGVKDVFGKDTADGLFKIFKEEASARDIYDSAVARYKKSEYEEALAAFNKIITSDTRAGDAFYYRALTYQKLGEYDNAISDFDKAVNLEENNGKYYAAYALACKDRGDEGDTYWAVEYAEKACELGYCSALKEIEKEMAFELGSLELLRWNSKEAARYFSIALKENPGSVESYEKRALAYYRGKEYGKAVEDYTQIIKLKPEDTFAYYAREIFYEMLGKSSRANEDLAYADNLASDKLEAGFNRASAFVRLGEEEVARTLSDKMLENYPKEARAYLYHGIVYINASSGYKEYAQAMEDFTRAIELDPKYRNAYMWRGYAYDSRYYDEYDKAVADYTEAIKIDPAYARAYGNRAFAYKNMGDFKKAADDYTKAISLEPDDIYTYEKRAEVYEKIGEYEKAVQDYTYMITHKPDDNEAYINRAKTYEALGEYANAMADYQKAVKNKTTAEVIKNYEKLDPQKRTEYEQAFRQAAAAVRKNPNDAAAYLARAEAYINLGGKDWKISEDYEKAIELKPSFEAYYSRGVYNSDIRNAYYDAIRDFDQAIKINPQSAKTYYARGRLLFKNKNSYFAYSSEGKPIDYRWDNAAADFTKVIKLEPDKADGYFSRAYAYEKSEKHEEAIADYAEAIKLNPAYGSAYNNRALIYSELEQYGNAIADFGEAIRIDPKETLYKANRANVYKETKEYEKAIADYSEAIELDPNDAGLYDGRSKVYESADLYTPAIKDAKKACELSATGRCFQLAHLKDSVTEHEFGKEAFVNKNYKEAVRLYTIAIKKYPKESDWIYFDRSDAYRALGDIKNAEKDEKLAGMNEPKYSPPKSEKEKEIEGLSEIVNEAGSAKAYDLRGLSFYRYKDYKNAVKDFTQAIKLEPEYAASYNYRAFAYAAAKDFKKAAKDAERACELGNCDAREVLKMLDDSNKAIKSNPQDAKAYSNRAAAYIWLNDLKQATIDAEKACELGDCEALEGMGEKGLAE